ncbi:MAG: hypothetical protein PHZ19_07750 [Candidatus Thermoplasmatota archaeon]|nr:hypothetical protein [Candidatus Thermoplasmatota archaeon]
MTVNFKQAPFPINYRELWLAESISGVTVPSQVIGGHPLTFSAFGGNNPAPSKKTTCNGVHLPGGVNSNVDLGAQYNAAGKIWFSFRFKLDTSFAAGSPATYFLLCKRVDVNNRVFVFLNNADGKLSFRHISLTVTLFTLNGKDGAGDDITSWQADTWYHVYAAIGQASGGGAPSDGARFRVDNGVATTSPDVTAIPNGGNIVLGDQVVGGGNGFVGVGSDLFIGTGDISDAEETSLYNGFPPRTATSNEYALNEGRGVTATDTGSALTDGTLDSACTWSFDSRKDAVIHTNGRYAIASSSAGIDCTGELTVVWVGKMKATYISPGSNKFIMELSVDVNNWLAIYSPNDGTLSFATREAAGAIHQCQAASIYTIDSYGIIIGTRSLSGVFTKLYFNGSLAATRSAGVDNPVGAFTGYLGFSFVYSDYPDISKPIMAGLIDGVLTNKEILEYSRYLNGNLGLGIKV